MISEMSFCCTLQDKTFDPLPMIDNPNIIVNAYNCFGDIGDRGRYKNKPYDYGYIRFTCKSNSLNEFLDIIETPEVKDHVNKVSDRVLDVLIEYEGQCNFKLSLEEISKIHSLGLFLAITCYVAD